MTGTHWLTESGFLDGPVLITNTHSVGVVRDAFLGWLVKNKRSPGTNTFDGGFYTYPVVAETYDGTLNDINGFHVKPADVESALQSAATGSVAEGNVGGGTGMICYGFKKRDRDIFAETGFRAGRIYHRRAGAVQLRVEKAAPHRRPPGGPRVDEQSAACGSRMALDYAWGARFSRERSAPRSGSGCIAKVQPFGSADTVTGLSRRA